jgi:hypothetical protein
MPIEVEAWLDEIREKNRRSQAQYLTSEQAIPAQSRRK